MITDFFILFVGHCIGDYPLQGEFLSKYKSKNNFILAIHCALYTMSILVALLFTNSSGDIYNYRTWVIGIIFISHFIIDKWKCIKITELETQTISKDIKDKSLLKYYYIDQVLHIIINTIIYEFI